MENNLWSLIHHTLTNSGSIEQAVFYLLMAFSIACWAILLIKLEELFVVKRNNKKFLAIFQGSDSFGAVLTAGLALGRCPLFSIFKAALASLEGNRTEPAGPAANDPRQIRLKPASTPHEMLRLEMQRASAAEFSRLQFGLSFLATAGATSPFIGLFGTIWGIMGSFRELGNQKSASLAVVAPGISSALIATAAGLAVAIPAVIAYNWFVSRIDALQNETDTFIEEVAIIAAASKFLDKTAPPAMPQYIPPALPQSTPIMLAGQTPTNLPPSRPIMAARPSPGAASMSMGPAPGAGRGRRRSMSEINITPMVDAMLVLLVIFMITAPALDKQSIDVDLPKVKGGANKTAAGVDIVLRTVVLDAEGKVHIAGKTLEPPEIPFELPKLLKGHENETLTLKASRALPFETVVKVMSIIRGAGIKGISIAVDAIPTGK